MSTKLRSVRVCESGAKRLKIENALRGRLTVNELSVMFAANSQITTPRNNHKNPDGVEQNYFKESFKIFVSRFITNIEWNGGYVEEQFILCNTVKFCLFKLYISKPLQKFCIFLYESCLHELKVYQYILHLE